MRPRLKQKDIVPHTAGARKRKRSIVYLGVPTGHVLHDTPRGKPPAAHKCGWTGRGLPDRVDGHVHHGPHPFGELLAEAQEVHFPYRNQRRQNLKLGMHLITRNPDRKKLTEPQINKIDQWTTNELNN